MRVASIHEIKQELASFKAAELVGICLRLGRFKKENKELLTYLLFEAHDEGAYIQNIKNEIDELFAEINTTHIYFAKKSLRKILRIANKHIRYSGSKQIEVEVLLHFCIQLKQSGLAKERNTVINKLYHVQLKKVKKTVDALHEDLQYEYQKSIEALA
ncbi:MAG: hypothetical protein H7178_02840 [Chitinophagaceae bacterium]|nr:hypothetical protein [Chitinophagaceae bacterium]